MNWTLPQAKKNVTSIPERRTRDSIPKREYVFSNVPQIQRFHCSTPSALRFLLKSKDPCPHLDWIIDRESCLLYNVLSTNMAQDLVVVRTANVKDASHIAHCQVSGWREAYAEFVPQAHLDSLSVAEKTAFWQGTLNDSNQAGSTVVAEAPDSISDPNQSVVVGFACFGPADVSPEVHSATDCPPKTTGELYAIYVDPESWSKGAGRALCAEVFQRFVRRGFEKITVNVFAENSRAIRFYQAIGFDKSGAGETIVGGRTVSTMQLTKDLV